MRQLRFSRWVAHLACVAVMGVFVALSALDPPFVVTEALAQSSSGDDAAYQKVVADPTIANMRKYLREFPFGAHRDDVKAMLDRQSEALAWQRAKTSNSRSSLSAYLELYPDGEHAAEAKRLMAAKSSASALHDYPDTTLNGTVSAQVTADMDTCRSLCTQRSGCAGFDHAASGNVCRLFSSVGSARGAAGSSAATREAIAGYNPAPADVPQPAEEPRQSEPQPQPQIAEIPESPETFNRFRNMDLAGRAIVTLRMDSVNQCESSCRDLAECIAYTFDRWNRKCFLKESTGQLKINARAISAVVASRPSPPVSESRIYIEYFNNKSFSGNGSRVSSAGSRDACESQCWITDSCVAFGFVPAQRSCTLYDDPGEYFSRRGVMSGAKRQD